MMKDYEILDSLKDTQTVIEEVNVKFGEYGAPQNVSMVIEELINKYTPHKPTGTHTNRRCPVCGRRVRSGQGSSSFVRDKRCQDCGQIFDWD